MFRLRTAMSKPGGTFAQMSERRGVDAQDKPGHDGSGHPFRPRLAICGMLGMSAAFGIGRFVYTPILPQMLADGALTPSSAGLVAGVISSAISSARSSPSIRLRNAGLGRSSWAVRWSARF